MKIGDFGAGGLGIDCFFFSNQQTLFPFIGGLFCDVLSCCWLKVECSLKTCQDRSIWQEVTPRDRAGKPKNDQLQRVTQLPRKKTVGGWFRMDKFIIFFQLCLIYIYIYINI